jgi:hypothetical protein
MPTEQYDNGLNDNGLREWRPPSGESRTEPRTQPGTPRARRARRKKASPLQRRGPWKVVLGIVVLAGVLALSPVRTLLKQSFTRLPQPYATIYFTSSPTIDGAALHVPLTVESADAPQSDYGLKVWTVSATGAVSGKTTAAKVTTHGGVTATVVTMPVTPNASVVWVSLDGTQQTLHYRIGRT